MTDAKRRAGEIANLLEEHNSRVAMLEPFVEAHSLMPRDVIVRAEQQNLRRAQELRELCKRYSLEVHRLVDRHTREQDEERGVTQRQSADHERSPPAAPAPAPKKMEV